MCHVKQAGIHGLPVEIEVEKLLGLDGKGIRLRTTDLSHSSRSVKSLYGNTRVCGRISPTQ